MIQLKGQIILSAVILFQVINKKSMLVTPFWEMKKHEDKYIIIHSFFFKQHLI
jgi:hypothetical protein